MDILTRKAVFFSVKISVSLDLLRAGPLPFFSGILYRKGIWCLRDAEHDVDHGDDRVHKRDGVDGKICPDLLSGKDVRTA